MNATPPAICRPAPLFAQMRIASGGANWRRVGETTAFGNATTSGLGGTARVDTDVVTGRSAQRMTIRVMGSSADVYDGRTLWEQDISGGVHPRDSAFPRALAITDAYLARHGYDAPASATFACMGQRHEGGKDVIVVRVQPPHGIPADLSIDRDTRLLDRISERYPIETQVTEFGDYRLIDGVALPFSITSGSSFEPKSGFAIAVTRYRLRRRAEATDFARPVEINGPRMIGGVSKTTVPMQLEGRQLLVPVSINGHAPMLFVLDTGGHAIVTTLAAKALGLRGSGAGESGGSGAGTIGLQFTRVRSVRIGQAEVPNQPFLIIPYPYSFYERGQRMPLAGIVGLEVFERFATRLDFAHRLVTLTPLRAARPPAGEFVPLSFQDDMPMTQASADGHAGLFGLDTGNAGALILFGTFLKSSGLLADYPAGIAMQGQGTGGTNAFQLETLRRFALGRHVLTAVPSAFTQMKSGSFSSWTEAGNLGISILSRFTPTFDYATQKLSLETGAQVGPIPANHAGMGFVKNEARVFDVVTVAPNAPAARAGVKPGDRIVAIDGVPARALSRADLFDRTIQPRGALRLRIERRGVSRDVTVAWPVKP